MTVYKLMTRWILPLTGLLVSVAPVHAQRFSMDGWKTDFSKHTVPMNEIVSGGPSKDGIPAIDRPKFVSVGDADRWLKDREPVVVVKRRGKAKAYPLQILIWHEIVNDQIVDLPVSVTFCPLCNTAVAFDRRFKGKLLDFGTTGRLRNSDLVMYDRQTETWWQQATGEGIVGELAGERLTFVSAPVMSWKDFKESEPDGRVLSRNTGARRPYGKNPYKGYDSSGGPIRSFFSGKLDKRLPAMERIVTLDVEGDGIAIPFSALKDRRVIDVSLGDREVTVLWTPGTASALDDGTISEGRDVGASGVFEKTLDGRELDFKPAGAGKFTDTETGSTWSIAGTAIEGPLRGKKLTPVPHTNSFWFAWGVFKPDTKIVTR